MPDGGGPLLDRSRRVTLLRFAADTGSGPMSSRLYGRIGLAAPAFWLRTSVAGCRPGAALVTYLRPLAWWSRGRRPVRLGGALQRGTHASPRLG